MWGTLVLIVAFAAGAVPFSYMIAQSLASTDLRQVGTGTVSGTSLYRVAGFIPLVAGGLCDIGKGALGPLLAGDRWLLMAFAGAVSVIGHNWSVIVLLLTRELRGGKGAAVLFGPLLLVAPLQFLVSLAVGLVLLRLTRYMSLAVLTGVTLVMLWILVMVNAGELSEIYNAYALLGALLIYLRFLGNIRRLLSGTERRVGESA